MNDSQRSPAVPSGERAADLPAHLEDAYVISPVQEGMLFHTLYAPQAGMYVRQIIYRLREELNVPALQAAWRRVVQRHAILRSSLRWEDTNEPVQEVHRHVELPFAEQDWRALPAATQHERLEEYLQADRRRGFVLVVPPLMRLLLIRMADADYRLLWTFHHILSDGRSDVLVSKEVFTFYDALREGREAQLAEPPSYRNHGAWVRAQDFGKAEQFWRAALHNFTAPTPLGGVRAATATTSTTDAGRAEQTQRLSAAATAALRALAETNGLTLNTVVQGAWALLQCRVPGLCSSAATAARPTCCSGPSGRVVTRRWARRGPSLWSGLSSTRCRCAFACARRCLSSAGCESCAPPGRPSAHTNRRRS
jgi:NRPS condensation-like uncharacterized protein